MNDLQTKINPRNVDLIDAVERQEAIRRLVWKAINLSSDMEDQSNFPYDWQQYFDAEIQDCRDEAKRLGFKPW